MFDRFIEQIFFVVVVIRCFASYFLVAVIVYLQERINQDFLGKQKAVAHLHIYFVKGFVELPFSRICF
jgi:hypothetical protein